MRISESKRRIEAVKKTFGGKERDGSGDEKLLEKNWSWRLQWEEGLGEGMI